MSILLSYLFPRKLPRAEWHNRPTRRGWWLSFERGRGFDELYWSGEDDSFEIPLRREAQYFGPFNLPL